MILDNVRLLVTNYDECFRFYYETLGFQVLWGELGGSYASFGTEGGKSFAIFSRAEMAEAVGASRLPPEAAAQDRFALILDAGDLEAVVAKLKAKGVALVADVQARPDWGIRTAHLRDPDGNLIELFDALPSESWDEHLRVAHEKYK